MLKEWKLNITFAWILQAKAHEFLTALLEDLLSNNSSRRSSGLKGIHTPPKQYVWIQANKVPTIYYVVYYLSLPSEDCFV